MTRAFGYLAWRTAYNRSVRQLRQLRSPRYLVALVLGLAYLWVIAVQQRPRHSPFAASGAKYLELLGALGLAGVAALGMESSASSAGCSPSRRPK